MGSYSLVLLAVTAFLTCVDSASSVAAINSPTEVRESATKQSRGSAKRFLRADEAADEGSEARMESGLFRKLYDFAEKWVLAAKEATSSKASTKKWYMNAEPDESVKVPLLEHHHAALLEKLISEVKALELARSAVPQPAEYVSTPILDGIMSEWLYYDESMEDVFELLEMKIDGYDNFSIMKYVVLEEYRARIMKTGPKEEPTGLEHFLMKICDDEGEIYGLLIQDLMALRHDSWLKDAKNQLFTLWLDHHSPERVESFLEPKFPGGNDETKTLLKAYSKFYEDNKPKDPPTPGDDSNTP